MLIRLRTGPARSIAAVMTGKTAQAGDHPELDENDTLWTLMKVCWKFDPTGRPSMAVVVAKVRRAAGFIANMVAEGRGVHFLVDRRDKRKRVRCRNVFVRSIGSKPDLPSRAHE